MDDDCTNEFEPCDLHDELVEHEMNELALDREMDDESSDDDQDEDGDDEPAFSDLDPDEYEDRDYEPDYLGDLGCDE